MTLNLSTTNMFVSSPTMFKAWKNSGSYATKEDEWPMVPTPGNISVSFSTDESDNPELFVSVDPSLLDPTEDEEGNKEDFSVNFQINRRQAIYLKKHIEAFLEANPL